MDFLAKEHFYIEGLNLIGCANVDLTNLGDKEYKCTDFYIDYDYVYKSDEYDEDNTLFLKIMEKTHF